MSLVQNCSINDAADLAILMQKVEKDGARTLGGSDSEVCCLFEC
jgi:hypothetical protein